MTAKGFAVSACFVVGEVEAKGNYGQEENVCERGVKCFIPSGWNSFFAA